MKNTRKKAPQAIMTPGSEPEKLQAQEWIENLDNNRDMVMNKNWQVGKRLEREKAQIKKLLKKPFSSGKSVIHVEARDLRKQRRKKMIG